MSCMSLFHEEMWPQLLRSRENHQSHAIVMLQELLFFTSSLVLMEEIWLTTLDVWKKPVNNGMNYLFLTWCNRTSTLVVLDVRRFGYGLFSGAKMWVAGRLTFKKNWGSLTEYRKTWKSLDLFKWIMVRNSIVRIENQWNPGWFRGEPLQWIVRMLYYNS